MKAPPRHGSLFQRGVHFWCGCTLSDSNPGTGIPIFAFCWIHVRQHLSEKPGCWNSAIRCTATPTLKYLLYPEFLRVLGT